MMGSLQIYPILAFFLLVRAKLRAGLKSIGKFILVQGKGTKWSLLIKVNLGTHFLFVSGIDARNDQ